MDDIIGTHRCLKRLELLLLRRLVRLYLLRSLRARILQSLYAIYNTNTGVSDSNNNGVPVEATGESGMRIRTLAGLLHDLCSLFLGL